DMSPLHDRRVDGKKGCTAAKHTKTSGFYKTFDDFSGYFRQIDPIDKIGEGLKRTFRLPGSQNRIDRGGTNVFDGRKPETDRTAATFSVSFDRKFDRRHIYIGGEEGNFHPLALKSRLGDFFITDGTGGTTTFCGKHCGHELNRVFGFHIG